MCACVCACVRVCVLVSVCVCVCLCLCVYTNSDNFIEYELIAVISCVFGGDEKEWINGDPEDGEHIYI